MRNEIFPPEKKPFSLESHLAQEKSVREAHTRKAYTDTSNLAAFEKAFGVNQPAAKTLPAMEYRPAYIAVIVNDDMKNKVLKPIGIDVDAPLAPKGAFHGHVDGAIEALQTTFKAYLGGSGSEIGALPSNKRGSNLPPLLKQEWKPVERAKEAQRESSQSPRAPLKHPSHVKSSKKGGAETSPYKDPDSYLVDGQNNAALYREKASFGHFKLVPLTSMATAMSHSSGMDVTSAVSRTYVDPKVKPSKKHVYKELPNQGPLGGLTAEVVPPKSEYAATIGHRMANAQAASAKPRILNPPSAGLTDAGLLLQLGKNGNSLHRGAHTHGFPPQRDTSDRRGGRAVESGVSSKRGVSEERPASRGAWGPAPKKRDTIVSNYDKRMARYAGAAFPHA